jgi:hypothetical protein
VITNNIVVSTDNPKPTVNHFFFAFNHASYYPGKGVDGVLVLVVNTPIKISKIGVSFRGAEFVSWYQGVRQQEECKYQNNFIDTALDVWPKEGEDDKDIFEVGTYTFPFSWPLPKDCPANYEELEFRTGDALPLVYSSSGMPRQFGEVPSYIRYYSTAFVDFSFPNDEKQEPQKLRMVRENGFKVVEAFDPKIIIQPPLVKKGTFEFLLGIHPLEFTLSVANGGVLFSGQNLYVNVNANNKSTRTIDNITFILIEHLTFSATNPEGEVQTFERRRDALHAEVADSQIVGGATYQQDLMFSIPPTTPPTLQNAKSIKRSYELICLLNVSFGTNVQINVPIQILEWSALLKDDLPKHVPITTRQAEKIENE